MNFVSTGEAYKDLVDFGFGDEVDESCDDDDNSSLLALLELIGDDADKAINLVTEAADWSDILDLVIDGIFDDTD